MDSALPIEFGFFGKIPAVGDFVSRNLRHSQIAHADQWFQQGLSTLQTQVEIWRDNYLVAPVWRFLIPRGHWADTALCGIIMPSIDRVGRYFPLAVWGDLPAAMERDALGLCAQ
jgi:type VI secretion system protein ImpM